VTNVTAAQYVAGPWATRLKDSRRERDQAKADDDDCATSRRLPIRARGCPACGVERTLRLWDGRSPSAGCKRQTVLVSDRVSRSRAPRSLA
jgi:hypothetical protein